MKQQHFSDDFSMTAVADDTAIRKEARVIHSILDRESRQVVGWIYRWNTGQVAILWKDIACGDVVYD